MKLLDTRICSIYISLGDYILLVFATILNIEFDLISNIILEMRIGVARLVMRGKMVSVNARFAINIKESLLVDFYSNNNEN